MGAYAKKITKKQWTIILSLAIILVSLLIFAVGSANRSSQREAYIQTSALAATARQERQSLAKELEAESLSLNQVKASALSAAYKEEFEAEKARKASATQAVTPAAPVAPAPAGFRASAYGYTGADNIAYWRGINSDVIGWLRVPGTNISHAVVQNTSDVNYYTPLGYDKQPNHFGVIWTNPATRGGTSSQISSNTVLYGHNWTNCSASPRIGNANDIMFAQLTAYHWLSQAQSYPYIYYSTLDEQMTFKIFACFYTEEAFSYNQTEGDIAGIISEARRRSRHEFAVDVNSSDKIITLSTCTRAYGNTSNQRFVVMARLLRPGETVSEVTVTSNPGHKQPSVW